MAELSQIMDQVRSFTGGSANKFKRGVVYDPTIGKKISVTIVATGFEISNLPQIDMDDNPDGPVSLNPGEDIWDDDDTDTNVQENEMGGDIQKQVYIRPEGKPALILEPSDDISQLERVPAYVRRNKKLTGIMTEF